jgi:hypothetical protein
MSAAIGWRAGRTAALAAAAWLVLAGAARAEPEKRSVPDYDGRGDPPASAGDVALWVPRIVLSPLYLVSEFVIRRPLGALVSAAERAQVPEVLYELFTFGPDHDAGIAPIAFVDFGFNPSVGVYAFWNDAFAPHHDLRLSASTWGASWLAGRLSDSYRFGAHREHSAGLHVTAVRRPDYAFFGLGSRSLEEDISRYGADTIDAGGVLDLGLWRASRITAGLGVHSVSFHRGDYDDDPTLEQQVAAGVFARPPGYATGYTSLYNRMLIAIDSRLRRPAPGSGVRLELSGEQGNDVRAYPGGGFVRYGATLGGFLDLNDHSRVVSLSIGAQFADPLGSAPLPFTELVTLGGGGPMRGFLPGRLVGRSAAVALLRYRWPIWAWIDGSIQAALGNVFDAHLEGFSTSLLRFSGAIGIERVGSPDSSLELLVGMGSETFAHGGQITSARVLLGTNHGF